jgi:integrase
MLDAMPRRSPLILTNSENRPWTSHGFSSSWRKACKRLGIVGLTFNDLRGTFVTRAALSGATEAEIAMVTGHSLLSVRSILDKHYLHRDVALAASTRSGSSKGKKGERKMQNGLQNSPCSWSPKGGKYE